MADQKQENNEIKQDQPAQQGFGPTKEITTVWRITLKNGTIYNLVTDWSSIGTVMQALQNKEQPFIGGLNVEPNQLDLKDGQPPILYNFVIIPTSEIVSVEGTF